MSFILGEFTLFIAAYNTCMLWNQPWLKQSYYFTYLQTFYFWAIAGLFWICIHPYAQRMNLVTPPLEHLHGFMKAESDFYNVISMCELAGIFIDTFMAVSIVWVQIAYHRICNDEANGVASQLMHA